MSASNEPPHESVLTIPHASKPAASPGIPVFAETALTPAVSMPAGFRWNAVGPAPGHVGAPPAAPSLGPLAAFVGNWTGTGFNTIFRPQSQQTPTPLPNPPQGPTDNVLELNLTTESLSFSPSLGSVPNRGMVQGDVFLNGVPYLQAINDVTTGQPVGIHLEPGVWLSIPSTSDPAESPTVARMASIPHGTTIVAQGTFTTSPGGPNIPAVDITPFPAVDPGGSPGQRIPFLSQTLTNADTSRIPQDLSSFNTAGTITQEILSNPNQVLLNHIQGQNIVSTTEIDISTAPATPLFGGGTDNIAFLLGSPAALTNPAGNGQNAQAIQMTATFWIETVEHTIFVPPFQPGQPPLTLHPENSAPGLPAPSFIVNPPIALHQPRTINFTSTQIQYSQQVMLNFNTLTWPHVSVATLVPAGPVPVPPSVWSA
jgi:hypothetical protein